MEAETSFETFTRDLLRGTSREFTRIRQGVVEQTTERWP
jgi:hypothetical protein